MTISEKSIPQLDSFFPISGNNCIKQNLKNNCHSNSIEHHLAASEMMNAIWELHLLSNFEKLNINSIRLKVVGRLPDNQWSIEAFCPWIRLVCESWQFWWTHRYWIRVFSRIQYNCNFKIRWILKLIAVSWLQVVQWALCGIPYFLHVFPWYHSGRELQAWALQLSEIQKVQTMIKQ